MNKELYEKIMDFAKNCFFMGFKLGCLSVKESEQSPETGQKDLFR